MNLFPTQFLDVNHAHVFCGIGGGAKGFNAGQARVGQTQARMRCLGGIDVDARAIRNFEKLAKAPGTVLDLFAADQYRRFHGHEPPDGWREATPDDIRRAFQHAHPHLLFLSAPCKGFSGLLAEAVSRSGRYQALNELTLRGIWLTLEAFKDDPIELIAFENVPRIRTRGAYLLDQIEALLQAYGYAVARSEHDCGELGKLAQHRWRFLLMARHVEKVPPFLYEPAKRRVRGVGEVLERFPVPGPVASLPMHRLPALQWQTWVRLAFVEAGSDWRSLNRLRVAEGVLTDYRLVPDVSWQHGVLGVRHWDEPSGTLTSRSGPTNGAYAVADPRVGYTGEYQQIGVRAWDEPSGTVSGQMQVGGGPHSVADPRYMNWHPGASTSKLRVTPWDGASRIITGAVQPASGAQCVADPRIAGAPRFNHVYRIVPWHQPAPAVAGSGGPAGGLAVADPRSTTEWAGKSKYVVAPFDQPANTVIAASTTGNGAYAVADPRPGFGDSTHHNILRVTPWTDPSRTVTAGDHPSGGGLCVADPRPVYARDRREAYHTAGEYGVVPWDAACGAVPAHGQHDNGRWSVADPRPHEPSAVLDLPKATDRLVAVIRALDGTYHRPFTTLELAALQSLVDPDEIFELDVKSDAAAREFIGNAVPPDAAQAMASVMAETLLLAWAGETFVLSATPVWVRPIAIALSVDPHRVEVSR